MNDVYLKLPKEVIYALDSILERLENVTGDVWSRDELIGLLICQKFEDMWSIGDDEEDREAIEYVWSGMADFQFKLLCGGK